MKSLSLSINYSANPSDELTWALTRFASRKRFAGETSASAEEVREYLIKNYSDVAEEFSSQMLEAHHQQSDE